MAPARTLSPALLPRPGQLPSGSERDPNLKEVCEALQCPELKPEAEKGNSVPSCRPLCLDLAMFWPPPGDPTPPPSLSGLMPGAHPSGHE